MHRKLVNWRVRGGSHNEKVTVNFGAEPFRFDLAAMVQEEAEQQAAAVQRCDEPPRCLFCWACRPSHVAPTASMSGRKHSTSG